MRYVLATPFLNACCLFFISLDVLRMGFKLLCSCLANVAYFKLINNRRSWKSRSRFTTRVGRPRLSR